LLTPIACFSFTNYAYLVLLYWYLKFCEIFYDSLDWAIYR